MISLIQIEQLAKRYQIDDFTIFREYLQLFFLNYFYQQPESAEVYFKGGTAIRLLFGSVRFSEDLDFSTKLNKNKIASIIKKTEADIKRELPELKIVLWHLGKSTTRFRIKYHHPDLKYPLAIRLDFHHVAKLPKTQITALKTDFPIVIYPLILHLSETAILAEKEKALETRGKGRDFFDVWYLWQKGIAFVPKIKKEALLQKIKACSQARLRRDLSQFLPQSYRQQMVESLKARLIEACSTHIGLARRSLGEVGECVRA